MLCAPVVGASLRWQGISLMCKRKNWGGELEIVLISCSLASLAAHSLHSFSFAFGKFGVPEEHHHLASLGWLTSHLSLPTPLLSPPPRSQLSPSY